MASPDLPETASFANSLSLALVSMYLIIAFCSALRYITGVSTPGLDGVTFGTSVT